MCFYSGWILWLFQYESCELMFVFHGVFVLTSLYLSCLCWLRLDLCELMCISRLCLCWIRYDLCELVCISRLCLCWHRSDLFRDSVYFPGCVRADIGVIYASSCVFLGCVCADFTMIYASWCIFPGSVGTDFAMVYASWCLFSRLCVWWWSLLYIDVCINRITRDKNAVCSTAEFLEQTHYVFCLMWFLLRWRRYDLCDLVFVYQSLFVLALVWFMRVCVCLTGWFRAGFGMICASWCSFTRLCSFGFGMIYSSWGLFSRLCWCWQVTVATSLIAVTVPTRRLLPPA